MQTVIDIGFFEDFKGGDTLLLVATRETLGQFAGVALSLSAPDVPPVAVHALPFVNAHGITLEARLDATDIGVRRSGSHFTWARSASGWRSVHDLVQGLIGHDAAHQYLDGPSDEVTVMLSVGEYDASVWQLDD